MNNPTQPSNNAEFIDEGSSLEANVVIRLRPTDVFPTEHTDGEIDIRVGNQDEDIGIDRLTVDGKFGRKGVLGISLLGRSIKIDRR